jgi:hypothetical protein
MVRWTESMVAGARVQGLSLNESHWLADQRLRLKKCEGVSDNLIVAVKKMRSWWRARPTAVVHRSKSLQAPVHQTRQGFHLWHHGDVGNSIPSPWDGKLQCSSGEDEGTKGAAVFRDPSGTVDSARVAAHWRGGKHHTAARVSTIVDKNSP